MSNLAKHVLMHHNVSNEKQIALCVSRSYSTESFTSLNGFAISTRFCHF